MMGRHVSRVPPAPEVRPARAFVLTIMLQVFVIMLTIGVVLAAIAFIIFNL